MGDPTKEGRIREVRLGRETILNLLTREGFNGNRIHRFVALPNDAYVCSVDYDWQRLGFRFQVASMEFSPVAPGAPIPELEVRIETIDLATRLQEACGKGA